MPRIGYLSLQSKSDSRLEAFLAGMREVGYVEGKTITIEWRLRYAMPREVLVEGRVAG